MPDICVIYLSEDKSLVDRLVFLMRKHWDVWSAQDIAHGDWEEAVRDVILKSSAVVPVLSQYLKGDRKTIIRDEMVYAKKHKKPIFPFLVDTDDIPFGFGYLNHTNADGWTGEEKHPGYQQLKAKLAKTIGKGRQSTNGSERAQELVIRGKTLKLPAFIFSLSSHETQVEPKEGAPLLHFLEPGAVLVSAYDAWKYYRRDKGFNSSMKKLRESQDILLLDSGNYEAYRKDDRYAPKTNPKGWHKDMFRETALRLKPDLAFSFDSINPTGSPETIVSQVVASFESDDRALKKKNKDIVLCPIVHMPKQFTGTRANCAAYIVSGVARELAPLMIAIPERELGDGLLERARTVRDIRKALDRLGKYYSLHLLGTGNPLSIIVLAAAGADSFDGLEWCRTVADPEKGFLFHFQHFDCFSQTRLHQIQDLRIRSLLQNQKASYGAKVLGSNVEFFKDWTRTMQRMIHSGQSEILLKMVPHIGPQIFRELSL